MYTICFQFTRTGDDNTKEEVISDPNTNIFQYHLTGPDYETWVVDDFNRVRGIAKYFSVTR